jgi:hypothetical protein
MLIFKAIKYYLILAITLIGGNSFGQKDTITWGSEFSIEKREYLDKIISVNNQLTIAIKLSQSNPSILHLLLVNPNMDVTGQITLQSPVYDNAQAAYIQTYKMNEKILVFSNAYNPTKRLHYLLAQELNTETFTLSQPKKLLTYQVVNDKNLGEFRITISPDNEKLLVAHHLLAAKDDHLARRRFMFATYNYNLENLWSKNLELPNLYMEAQAVDFGLTNLGNVTVLNASGNISSIRRRTYTFSPTLLVIFPEDNQIKDFNIEIKGRRISTIKKTHNNNKIILAGTFGNTNTLDAKGAFLIQIDEKTRTTVQSGFQPFTDEMLLSFAFDRRNERSLQIEDLDIQDILTDNEGNILLIGEQNFITESTTQDIYSGQIIRTYRYHKNAIAVIKLTPTGQISYVNKIPKNQLSLNINTPHFSFIAQNFENRLNIIYNDNIKNTADPKDQDKNVLNATTRRMQTNLTTITPDAKMQSRIIYDNRSDKTVPFTVIYTSNPQQNHLILFGEKNKGYVFGKIEL